jgi:transposase
MNDSYALIIGLDWADAKHDLAIMENDRETRAQIASSPEAIDKWLIAQHEQRPEGRFAICLEQSRGALFYILSKYDFLDLYPINPGNLASYRKAFSPSGAKDDLRDAHLLLDYFLNHSEQCRRVEPDTVEMRTLAALCEDRRKCVNERTSHVNALQSALKSVFPQALELCGEKLYGQISLDFLERWATLEDFQRAREKTIREFYKKHHGCKSHAERAEEIRRVGLCATQDQAITAPHRLKIELLLGEIRVGNAAVKKYDKAIVETSEKITEFSIFKSFPGAGAALAPRLTAAFGSNRQRWENAASVQAYMGVAPVTVASGKSRIVHWRFKSSKFLRQTLVEFAKESIKQSAWARVYYDQKRQEGMSHNKILRALAWKWVRIFWRCWHTGEKYDEARYLNALKNQGSWIAQACAA